MFRSLCRLTLGLVLAVVLLFGSAIKGYSQIREWDTLSHLKQFSAASHSHSHDEKKPHTHRHQHSKDQPEHEHSLSGSILLATDISSAPLLDTTLKVGAHALFQDSRRAWKNDRVPLSVPTLLVFRPPILAS